MLYIILMHISHIMWVFTNDIFAVNIYSTIQKWYETKANLRSVLLWQNRQWNRWGNWQQPQNWQWACSNTVDKDTVQRHRSPEVRSQEPCPWEGSWQWGSEHSLTLILTWFRSFQRAQCEPLQSVGAFEAKVGRWKGLTGRFMIEQEKI